MDRVDAQPPKGRWRSWFRSSSAPAISPSAGRNRSSKRKPASVSDTLRVVRCSNRSPEALLQLPHRVAERRGRDVETRCRGSEAEMVGDRNERGQIGQVAAVHS